MNEEPNLLDSPMGNGNRSLTGREFKMGKTAAIKPEEDANVCPVRSDGITLHRKSFRPKIAHFTLQVWTHRFSVLAGRQKGGAVGPSIAGETRGPLRRAAAPTSSTPPGV